MQFTLTPSFLQKRKRDSDGNTTFAFEGAPKKQCYSITVTMSSEETECLDVTQKLSAMSEQDGSFIEKMLKLDSSTLQEVKSFVEPLCKVVDPTLGQGDGMSIFCLTTALPETFEALDTQEQRIHANTLSYITYASLKMTTSFFEKLKGLNISTSPSIKAINRLLKRFRHSNDVRFLPNATVRAYLLSTAPKLKPIEEDLFMCHLNEKAKCEFMLFKAKLQTRSIIFKLLSAKDVSSVSSKPIHWLTSKDVAMLKLYWCFIRYVPVNHPSIDGKDVQVQLFNLIVENAHHFFKVAMCEVHGDKILDTDLHFSERIDALTTVQSRVISDIVSMQKRHPGSVFSLYKLCGLAPPSPSWLRLASSIVVKNGQTNKSRHG
jgi:hypothetical protein